MRTWIVSKESRLAGCDHGHLPRRFKYTNESLSTRRRGDLSVIRVQILRGCASKRTRGLAGHRQQDRRAEGGCAVLRSRNLQSQSGVACDRPSEDSRDRARLAPAVIETAAVRRPLHLARDSLPPWNRGLAQSRPVCPISSQEGGSNPLQ